MNKTRDIQPRPDQAGDSDINCNGGSPTGGGGAPIGTPEVGARNACGGLDICRIKGYSGDTSTRLTVTGGTLRRIRLIGNQTIELFQKNWLLSIHPHLVLLHSSNKGVSVEIDSIVGNFQTWQQNHRKHSNPSEIEMMMLFVDDQLPTSLPGCKFTIVYD
ncbi:MAG: hypothetical protein M3Z23_08885 [Acidobacteriota bacterium]|nr:hypothetical protein [Acidobacteriota bacterium]